MGKIEPKKSKIFNSTVVIAFSTIYCYFCTHLFESSYLNYFKLNNNFIELTPNEIIIPIIFTLSIFLIIFSFLEQLIARGFFKKINNGLKSKILLNSIILIYLLFQIVIYPDKLDCLPVFIILFLSSLKDFIFPIFNRKNLSYIEKVNNNYRKQTEFMNKTISVKLLLTISRKSGDWLILFILFIMIFALASHDMGMVYAKNKNYFLTFQLNNKTYLVVKSYKDFLISKEVENTTIKNQALVIKLDDLYKDRIFLKNEKISNIKIE